MPTDMLWAMGFCPLSERQGTHKQDECRMNLPLTALNRSIMLDIREIIAFCVVWNYPLGWRDSTVSRVLALNAVNPSFDPWHLIGSPRPIRSDP